MLSMQENEAFSFQAPIAKHILEQLTNPLERYTKATAEMCQTAGKIHDTLKVEHKKSSASR